MNLKTDEKGGLMVTDEATVTEATVEMLAKSRPNIVEGTPMIYAAMVAVMADCEAIGKDNKHQQGYKFRGIDDIYNHIQGIKAKHGVFEVPEVLENWTEERKTSNGYPMVYRLLKIRYTFYAVDGSSVKATVIGEAMDNSDKGTNKAMSVAHKYALIQVFNIRTVDIDDADKNSPSETRPAQRQSQQSPPPAQRQGSQQAPPPPPEKSPAPQQQGQPTREELLQMFNKARAAFAAIGVEPSDMLTYVNKKTPNDVTREDLVILSNWLIERKEGAKK